MLVFTQQAKNCLLLMRAIFFIAPSCFTLLRHRPENGLIWPLRGTIAVRLWDICYRLSVVVVRGSHPYFYTQGRIYGEGVYADEVSKDKVFASLLHALTRKFHRKLCFYIEFSDLSRKMFGYRYFRAEGYFPVNWQEVHNSLHSMNPADRLSERMRDRIKRVYGCGVETREAQTEDEVHAFYRLLNGFYRLKMRRIIPPESQVRQFYKSDNGRIFITLYKKRVIGGSVCVFSNGNAYLWYLASKRKIYAGLHPNLMTVWYTIQWSWQHHYQHIYFLDVGLPFSKNPFREFILSFGGKPVAKYRWFKFTIKWINHLLSFIYRE